MTTKLFNLYEELLNAGTQVITSNNFAKSPSELYLDLEPVMLALITVFRRVDKGLNDVKSGKFSPDEASKILSKSDLSLSQASVRFSSALLAMKKEMDKRGETFEAFDSWNFADIERMDAAHRENLIRHMAASQSYKERISMARDSEAVSHEDFKRALFS